MSVAALCQECGEFKNPFCSPHKCDPILVGIYQAELKRKAEASKAIQRHYAERIAELGTHSINNKLRLETLEALVKALMLPTKDQELINALRDKAHQVIESAQQIGKETGGSNEETYALTAQANAYLTAAKMVEEHFNA